jgi:hypothetical protein
MTDQIPGSNIWNAACGVISLSSRTCILGIKKWPGSPFLVRFLETISSFAILGKHASHSSSNVE